MKSNYQLQHSRAQSKNLLALLWSLAVVALLPRPCLADSYQYDGAHRLVAWSSGSQRAEYEYDGRGELVRTRASVDSGATWTDVEQVVEDAGRVPNLVGTVESRGTTLIHGGTTFGDRGVEYAVSDSLGTVRGTVRKDRSVSRQQYTAFGEQRGAPRRELAAGFTGAQHLLDDGVHLSARILGRQGSFRARDSIGGLVMRPSTLNRYAYAQPTVMVDPTGHFVEHAAGAATQVGKVGLRGALGPIATGVWIANWLMDQVSSPNIISEADELAAIRRGHPMKFTSDPASDQGLMGTPLGERGGIFGEGLDVGDLGRRPAQSYADPGQVDPDWFKDNNLEEVMGEAAAALNWYPGGEHGAAGEHSLIYGNCGQLAAEALYLLRLSPSKARSWLKYPDTIRTKAREAVSTRRGRVLNGLDDISQVLKLSEAGMLTTDNIDNVPQMGDHAMTVLRAPNGDVLVVDLQEGGRVMRLGELEGRLREIRLETVPPK